MPAGANPLAISEVGYTYCTKVDVEKSLTESEPLLNINDEFVEGDARDPKYDINLEGKGDLPAALVAGSSDITVDGVTGGKSIVVSSRESEHNETWNDWSVNAKNYPSAT